MMKKGVILVVVIGIMFVIVILAFAALALMTQESRIAERKIGRTRALFTAQGGMIHALERLRTEGTDAATLALINADDPIINGLEADITVMARGSDPQDCPNSAPSDFCVLVGVDYSR
ncbi:MAG: hypothetical protein JSW40_02320 [Candidatus Omnitrophota bacterium]|nr:MAG: hypothetical protein JSW40_02320 [Candidatus Omnitrophota bacterium]